MWGFLIVILIIVAVVLFLKYTNESKADTEDDNQKSNKNNKKQKDEQHYHNFNILYDNIEDIHDNVIAYKDNIFLIGLKASPSNYLLKSGHDKDVIDSELETMLATLPDHKTHEVYFIAKGIYEDLSENIEEMTENLNSNPHLPEAAIRQGKSIIKNIEYYQVERPRIHHNIYIYFVGQYSKDNLTESVIADESKKMKTKIYEHALDDLMRIANRTASQLERANCETSIMKQEDYITNIYNSFNKKTAHQHPYLKQLKQSQDSTIVSAEKPNVRAKAMTLDNLDNINLEKEKEDKEILSAR